MSPEDRHHHYRRIEIQTRQSLEDARAIDDALLAYLLGMVLELIADAEHRSQPAGPLFRKAAG